MLGSPKPLCRTDEIADPGARGFEFETDDGPIDIILVRVGDNICGYRNSCPHQGTPLETFPDRFLTADRTELLCSTHGARFRLADGFCVSGPCKGKALSPIATVMIDGFVYLQQSTLT